MNQLEKFRDVHTFIFDVDGVFTNNEILILEGGELLRKMNVRDGYAVKKAIQAGYRVAIITGGSSEGVRKRLEALGIKDIYVGKQEKMEAYDEFVLEYDLNPLEILYMGDDFPDRPVMRRVGLPTCPSDAIPEILEFVDYISPYKGGDGCVRDVIEKVMRLQNKWIPE
jgi:3-deoxy-D-manno-octulosonate 8-phosphate phosphatase (KDO 8-P phosphatase)